MRSLSDVEWIFVVLAVLYFFESLLWRRPGCLAFVSRWGTYQRRRPALRLIGNEHGNLEVTGLFPSDAAILCYQPPLLMSSKGVVPGMVACLDENFRPGPLGERLSWQQLAGCTAVERTIRADGKMVGVLPHSKLATSLANELRRLAAMDDSSRGDAIDSFRDSMFRVDEIRSRIEAWRDATVRVRVGVWSLLGWIVAVGMAWHHGVLPFQGGHWTSVYLICLFVIWWVTVIFIRRAHRLLYPQDRWGRRKLVAYSLLSPAVPMRATDALGRMLFEFVHPLALSAALDDEATFKEVAGRAMRDAHFPIPPVHGETEETSSHDTIIDEIAHEDLQADIERMRSVLADRGVSPESLLNPPDKEDEHTMSYCPRCLQQFDLVDVSCDQCGGRGSIAFRDAASDDTASKSA